MAKKKRRGGGSHHHHRAGHRSSHNPRRAGGYARAGRRHHRNPRLGVGSVMNFLKLGLYALIGLVATRQIPQMILGTGNVGIIGYLANAATAFAVGWAANKFLGRDAGLATGIGGGVYVANRIIGDYFAPVQRYLSLSGIGDPASLGDIRSGYFPLPVPTDTAGEAIIPTEIRALPPAPAASAVRLGSGVGQIHSGRYGGRY